MATITKEIFSGSTNGKGVLIAATATPGTLVHTAVAGTTDIDLVHLWASNSSVSAANITIEYGEATASANINSGTTVGAAPQKILDGIPLQNGLTIKVFASTTNVINVYGYVNRITG